MKLICAILFVLFAFFFMFMSYCYWNECLAQDFERSKTNAQLMLSIVIVISSIFELLKLLFGKPEEE